MEAMKKMMETASKEERREGMGAEDHG